jgi:hypothetical protein
MPGKNFVNQFKNTRRMAGRLGRPPLEGRMPKWNDKRGKKPSSGRPLWVKKPPTKP